MKKPILILVAIALVILCISTLVPYEEIQDRVTFYYPRAEFGYGEAQGTIGSELREVGSRSSDLSYLLALYLQGPLDPSLVLPFPGKNISNIQTLTIENNIVNIALNDLGTMMTDSQFSLSCAALTKTCLELTDAQAVHITSGDRSVTMNMENLVFLDESTSVEIPNTEESE